jgi:hypothetical protein
MSLRSWLQAHPRLLERAYDLTHRLFNRADPLIRRFGYERTERWLLPHLRNRPRSSSSTAAVAASASSTPRA